MGVSAQRKKFPLTIQSHLSLIGIKACRVLNLVSLHCALETENVQVHRDFNERASKKEIILNIKREVRFADQPEVPNQPMGKTENFIKPSVPIATHPVIKDKEHLIEMYPGCFDGTIEYFEDYTNHITLDPNVKPIIHELSTGVPVDLGPRRFWTPSPYPLVDMDSPVQIY